MLFRPLPCRRKNDFAHKLRLYLSNNLKIVFYINIFVAFRFRTKERPVPGPGNHALEEALRIPVGHGGQRDIVMPLEIKYIVGTVNLKNLNWY